MLIANDRCSGRPRPNHESERQRTQPRAAISGQHFGNSAFDVGVPNLQGVVREARFAGNCFSWVARIQSCRCQ